MRRLIPPGSQNFRLSQYDPITVLPQIRHHQYRRPGDRRPRRSGDLPVDKHAISLLEELFPAESKKTPGDTTPLNKKRREIPNQPLDKIFPPELEDEIDELEEQKKKEGEEERAYAELTAKRKYADSTVLVLRNAGKNLCEEDFRRIVPGSTHIEGWGASTFLVKVIRSRSLRTLEPDGNYFLIFNDASAAQTYEQYAKQLHQLSQAHLPVPGDLTPSIPPPPIALDPDSATQGYRPPHDGSPVTKTYEKKMREAPKLSPFLADTSLYGALQSYALLPPTNRLDLRVAQQPHSPLLHQILRHGGYEALMRDRHPHASAEVLLSLAEGKSPRLGEVRRAIIRDRHVRGSRWKLVRSVNSQSSEPGRRKMNEALRELISPRQGGPITKSDVTTGGFAQVETKDDGDATEGDWKTIEAEGAEALESSSKQETKKEDLQHRFRKWWIVSFEEESEAKRFVASWHRRDVTELMWEIVPDGEVVVMNADMIW